MTSNLHSLTHLVEVVRNWGPIWAHEAFVFESWNKKILDNVTSSFAPADQVATRFLMYKFLVTIMHDNSVTSETKRFVNSLIKVPIGEKEKIKDKIIGIGKHIIRPLTNDEYIELMKAGYEPTNVTSFKKMKLNGIKYMCRNNKNYKFSDDTICDSNGEFGVIVAIVQFQSHEDIIGGIFIKRMRRIKYAFNTTFLNQVCATNNLIFIRESSLIRPAVQMSIGKTCYVMK